MFSNPSNLTYCANSCTFAYAISIYPFKPDNRLEASEIRVVIPKTNIKVIRRIIGLALTIVGICLAIKLSVFYTPFLIAIASIN